MRRALCDLTLWLFMVSAVWVPSSLQAQERLLVGVEFRVHSEIYRRNLYKKVGKAEIDLETLLAERLEREYGFFRWKAADQTVNRSNLSAVLRVSLEEGDAGRVGHSIWLRISAVPEDAGVVFDCDDERAAPLKFEDETKILLFTGAEPTSGVLEHLKARISEKLEGALANASFRQDLLDSFLGHVPISHRVELFPGPFNDLVAIGIDRKELRADTKSQMRMQPCSRLPGEDKAEAEIGLTIAKTRIYHRELASLLQTRISSCEFGIWKDSRCTEKVPLILQHRLGDGVDVFMTEYIGLYPGTDEQRTLAPWKG